MRRCVQSRPEDDEQWLWKQIVVVTSCILINHVLVDNSCLKVLPHLLPMSSSMSCFPTVSALDATRPDKPKTCCFVSVFVPPFFFSPQSHSGGSSNVHLGKTSFVQKGRSMFPKVLLQWCAAISSCAAEIGKPLHGATPFVCLLCQQATCAIRSFCYNPKLCHWTLVVVWPALVQSRCHHQMMLSCWLVRERWDAASCYAIAIL